MNCTEASSASPSHFNRGDATIALSFQQGMLAVVKHMLAKSKSSLRMIFE
jgi:hypothetical protein